VTQQTVARDLPAILCGLQGLGTMAVDLNRTHATNPLWPGRARSHLVWQTLGTVWLALIEVVLILAPGQLHTIERVSLRGHPRGRTVGKDRRTRILDGRGRGFPAHELAERSAALLAQTRPLSRLMSAAGPRRAPGPRPG
jgi:hypothetical protein